MKEYIKHLLIRTPLEQPAKQLQARWASKRLKKHPELKEIYLESSRLEQVMQTSLHRTSNCIDVGAHLGSVLHQMLQIAPEGHHMAFEAIPYKAHWLQQKFPEAEVYNVALSNTSGQVTFYLNTARSGFSGLRPQNQKSNEPVQEIQVLCKSLDEQLDPNYAVDLIKLDTEGAELLVLQGAINTLKHYRPMLLFECTRSGLANFGFTSSQMFDCLTQTLSYDVYLPKDYLAQQPPLDFEAFHQALQYPFQALNFVAVAQPD